MTNKELKTRLLEELTTSGESSGLKYGTIKKVILDKQGDEGFIGVFYKNCRSFETYKGQDTRPVEIFSYEISRDFEDDSIDLFLCLHMDCNGKDDRWQEKKAERQSDSEFFNYHT